MADSSKELTFVAAKRFCQRHIVPSNDRATLLKLPIKRMSYFAATFQKNDQLLGNFLETF